jgi:8-oxo-dGTP pyrophosphatase MutT (NUDIX family)
MTHPLTVKGVVFDATGAVLLAENPRREWELPGGRPMLGEPFETTVAREIAEETGLSVDVDALLAAWPFEVVPGRWVNVVAYGCFIRAARPLLTSAEHLDTRFVPAAELGALVLPPGYRAAIDRWRRILDGTAAR